MKKLVKRILVLCLAVLSATCFVACDSCGGEEQPKVELEYTLIDDGYSVSLKKGSPTVDFTVTVPAEYNGLPVTEIENKGFANRMFLTEVKMPNTIKKIGDEAFANTGITTITMPSTVEEIGKYAFGSCKYLEEVVILDDFSGWYDISFSKGDILDDVVTAYSYDIYSSNPVHLGATLKIKNGETTIETDEIIVPGSVEKIGVAQLYGFNVNQITIEEGVKEIGEGAFAFVKSANKITLPNSLQKIGASAFNSIEVSEIQLGEGLEIIEKDAFYGSTITKITIPDSVTSIGMRAFQNCADLKTVQLGSGLEKISSYMFADSGITEITIPENVLEISSFAFVGALSLKTVNFSEGLEKISDNAFAECSALEKVVLPASLSTVETSIFYACTALTDIDFGDGITEIPNQMVYGCVSLTKVRINKKVKFINQSAFTYCEELKNVYYTGTKIEWDNVWIGVGNDTLTADTVTIHYMAN